MEPEPPRDRGVKTVPDHVSMTERRDILHPLPPKPVFCEPVGSGYEPSSKKFVPPGAISRAPRMKADKVSPTTSSSNDSPHKRLSIQLSLQDTGDTKTMLPEDVGSSKVYSSTVDTGSMTEERDPVQGELGPAPVPFPLFEGEGDDQSQANTESSADTSKTKWRRMVDSENYVALSASSAISPKVDGENNGLLQRVGPLPEDLAHHVPLSVPTDAASTRLKTLDRSAPNNRSDDSGGRLGRRGSFEESAKVLNGSKERHRESHTTTYTDNSSNTSQGLPKDPSRSHAMLPSSNTNGLLTTPRTLRTAESKPTASQKGPQQQGARSGSSPIESKSTTEVRVEEPEPAPELGAKPILDSPSHAPPDRQAILKLAKPLGFCKEVESIGKEVSVERIAKAEKEGHPVMVESCSICKQQCTELNNRPERLQKFKEETIIAGLVGGCIHGTGIKIPCLAKGAPKEDPVQIFEADHYSDRGPDYLKRSHPGSSTFLQPVAGEPYTALFRCFVISPNQSEEFSRFYSKKDKQLLWDEVIPTMEELREASQSGIMIYEAVQIKGDILFIPPRAWYQVFPLQPNVIMSTWHTYTLESVSKCLDIELYSYHRICYSKPSQVRKIVYYYLQAVSRAISNKGKDPKIKGINTNQLSPKTIHELLRLFDRLLVEEYTGAYRRHEAVLEEPGPCDFCGAEIFHSAFICSGTLPNSRPSRDSCGVKICPLCCSEGRSCLCGSLRPCSVHDFDFMLATRNSIWKWLTEKHPSECSPNLGLLTSCDLYENTTYSHIMLGALAIQQNRRFQQYDSSVTKRNTELICSGGAIGAESHVISCRQSITCNDCHETICFRHLRDSGIRSSEAAFRSNHERNWHDIHTNWSKKWVQWTTRPEYTPEELDDKLLALTSSLSVCKPLKAGSVRLGFYDEAHPSITCATYEDDPISNSQDFDEEMASNADMSGFEPIIPGVKALRSKGTKRKSSTPGMDEVETPTKRKKRRTAADSAFNPKSKKPKAYASKTSKAKVKYVTTEASTPTFIEGYDTNVDLGARTSSPGTVEAEPSSDNGDPSDDSPVHANRPNRKSSLDLVFSGYPSDIDDAVPTSVSPTTPGVRTTTSEREAEMELVFEERIRQLELEKQKAEERNKELERRLLELDPQSSAGTGSETGHVQEVAIMTSPALPVTPLFVDTTVDKVAILDGEISALREKVDDMALENKELKSRLTEMQSILQSMDLELTTLKAQSWEVVNASRSSSTDNERKGNKVKASPVVPLLNGRPNQSRNGQEEEGEEDRDDELDLFKGKYY